jgi:hypothetical protein
MHGKFVGPFIVAWDQHQNFLHFQDLEMQSILNHMLHWEQKISSSHFSQYNAIYSEHAKNFNELKESFLVAVKSISSIRSCVQVNTTLYCFACSFPQSHFQSIHTCIYTHTNILIK